jgi:peptidoglycan/LPS O-acetylase OafA/YrhL
MIIALSGLLPGLRPARSGWRFKSIATYAHRRAWRILPPYWAALGFSLVMTWYVHPVAGRPSPDSHTACTEVVDPWRRRSAPR